MPKQLRIAVAQTTVRTDLANRADLRTGGREARRLLRAAHESGARLVHFPEGTLCSPVKGADWAQAAWDVQRQELITIAELAGDLGIWVVLGAVHRLTPPHRPHNSLYVLSDRGELVTRYDERMLSNTKITHLYAPGSAPRTFEVDGVRFGCLLGMEVHFPELFAEYERLDVDCVLFSTTGGGLGDFAAEARAHAAINCYWVSFAGAADQVPAGLVAPGGDWLARCAADGLPALAIADLDESAPEAAPAVTMGRPWRRIARGGIHAPHVVADPRSAELSAF